MPIKEFMPVNATPPEKSDFTDAESTGLIQQKFLSRLRDVVQYESKLNDFIQKVRSLKSYPERKWYMDLRGRLDKFTVIIKAEVDQLEKEDYKNTYPKLYDKYVNVYNTARTILNYLVQLNPREF